MPESTKLRLAFVLVLGACASAPGPKPEPIAAQGDSSPGPASATQVAQALLSQPMPAAAPFRCQSQSRASVRRKAKFLDFAAETLRPLPYGARVSDMPFLRPRRSTAHIQRALAELAPHANACFRWVRYGSSKTVELAPVLALKMSVSPAGLVGSVSVTAELKGPAAELATCVAEGIPSLRVEHHTARITRVSGKLRFQTSGLLPPRTRPKRPTAPPRRVLAEGQCSALPAAILVDGIHADVLAEFDDWDAADAELELQAARLKAKKEGRRIPVRPLDCVTIQYGTTKESLQRLIDANRGQYRECYRAALKRSPGLAGSITAQLKVDVRRQSLEARVLGVGDAALHECMSSALKEVAFLSARPGSPRYLSYTFDLDPSVQKRPSEGTALEQAQSLLALGDAQSAGQYFAKATKGARNEAEACEARLGALEAVVAKAPWMLDDRVQAASINFAKYAAEHGDKPALQGCRSEGAALTRATALGPELQRARGTRFVVSIDSGMVGIYETMARIDELLKAWPSHPARAELSSFVALALASEGKSAEAEKLLTRLLEARLSSDEAEHVRDSLGRLQYQEGPLHHRVGGSCPSY